LYAGIKDTTKYKYNDLKTAKRKNGADDLTAMEIACIEIERYGINHFISGYLSFTNPEDRKKYISVIEKGYQEISTFLKSQGVL
jgi:hypothetical protein